MSIQNFLDKIKGIGSVDKVTVLYLFIMVIVGISSFSLGRLSVNASDSLQREAGISVSAGQASAIASGQSAGSQLPIGKKPATGITSVSGTSQTSASSIVQSQAGKNYVASKSGKLYYTVTCSGAKRIADKNKIYFSTTAEAEKSGYKFATYCK